jgi:2-oxoglutarate ferredoxin oxidoreductase subunit delta
MAGKIVIHTERCKGCGLCVTVCPRNSIVISKRSNKSGYFPAETANSDCIGCAMCGIICPDAVIEVYRDDDTVREPSKKRRRALVKD